MENTNNPLLKVIISTRVNNEEKTAWVEELKNTADYPFLVVDLVVNPDGVSLTQIYSDFMKKDQNNAEIFLFIHDDIEFLKKGWGRELVRLFNDNPEYGIIGVAGSKQFDSKGAWWNYTKRYGQVLHRKDGKSWLTAFSPLIKDDLEEVAVVDGLFIGVHKHRVSKDFDKELMGFNFYDIDFALANYIDGKCKIGVTTNIRVAHNSVGELKPNWYENRDKINSKYGQYYPIDVDNDKKRRNKEGMLNERN